MQIKRWSRMSAPVNLIGAIVRVGCTTMTALLEVKSMEGHRFLIKEVDAHAV